MKESWNDQAMIGGSREKRVHMTSSGFMKKKMLQNYLKEQRISSSNLVSIRDYHLQFCLIHHLERTDDQWAEFGEVGHFLS